MQYKFEFHPYQRQFQKPLQTNHGMWEIREGIIISLTDETGKTGCGEIAPLSWFGSETITEALIFCQQLNTKITNENIFNIPDNLPACQFGFASAWEQLTSNSKLKLNQNIYSALLPTGKEVLAAWQTLYKQNIRTFKWKIGVSAIEQEIQIFTQLMQALPTDVKLRLDANGGLNKQQAKQWLQLCNNLNVEYLEQPLAVDEFNTMLELSREYSTPIALDESVATISQMQKVYEKGWRGIFVIKAAIAGYPNRLRQFCQTYQIDAVFSSVFETAIGRQAALNIASQLSHPNRAVGFGVKHWFNDDVDTWLKNLCNSH